MRKTEYEQKNLQRFNHIEGQRYYKEGFNLGPKLVDNRTKDSDIFIRIYNNEPNSSNNKTKQFEPKYNLNNHKTAKLKNIYGDKLAFNFNNKDIQESGSKWNSTNYGTKYNSEYDSTQRKKDFFTKNNIDIIATTKYDSTETPIIKNKSEIKNKNIYQSEFDNFNYQRDNFKSFKREDNYLDNKDVFEFKTMTHKERNMRQNIVSSSNNLLKGGVNHFKNNNQISSYNKEYAKSYKSVNSIKKNILSNNYQQRYNTKVSKYNKKYDIVNYKSEDNRIDPVEAKKILSKEGVNLLQFNSNTNNITGDIIDTKLTVKLQEGDSDIIKNKLEKKLNCKLKVEKDLSNKIK